MISEGGPASFGTLKTEAFDVFIYGLGFETRSTKIAESIGRLTRTCAIKMTGPSIHSLKKNILFAHTRKQLIVDEADGSVGTAISDAISRSRKGNKSIRIGFDLSSVNRLVLFEVLGAISRSARALDEVEIFYCPAAFEEPEPQFPCIEKLGPVNGAFSAFDVDLTKPLCLLMGVGFDAGVSMGIISHLEPRLTYCLWGTGVSKQFDEAVRRANFDFDFSGFNTRVLSYDLKDPVGAFQKLESVVYGLRNEYRIVIIPMGPKLFTLHAALIGIAYFGEVAVWRVQHSRLEPLDARPGAFCIRARLMTDLLAQFASRESLIFEGEI
jgi:hypothetical protein